MVIVAGSAPARRMADSSCVSMTEKLPLIWPLPPRIGSRMTGAETTSSSRTMANGRPTLAWVASANLFPPAVLKRKVTTGSPVRPSKPGCASSSCSPVTIARRSSE